MPANCCYIQISMTIRYYKTKFLLNSKRWSWWLFMLNSFQKSILIKPCAISLMTCEVNSVKLIVDERPLWNQNWHGFKIDETYNIIWIISFSKKFCKLISISLPLKFWLYFPARVSHAIYAICDILKHIKVRCCINN